MNIQLRLAEIAQRKKEIRSLLEGSGEVNLTDIQTEITNLEKEERSLQAKLSLLDNMQDDDIHIRSIKKPLAKQDEEVEEREHSILDTKEYRSAFLKSLQGKKLNEKEERAYSSALSSAGATIPTVVMDKIFEKVRIIAPMLDEITLLRVKGNVSIAIEGSRAAAGLHSENAVISDSGDTLVQVTLAGYEINKVVSISKTVSTMSINAFETWLTNMLGKDIARGIENQIINGSGSSAPKGVVNANTWGATNEVVVATGTPVALDDVLNTIALLPQGYDPNAKWLMNKKSLFTYIAKLKDTTGEPILIKDVEMGLRFYIMGYPIVLSDFAPDNVFYLGDFTTVVGNLAEDINVSASAHSGFLRNAVDFLGSALFDCKPALGEAIVRLRKTP